MSMPSRQEFACVFGPVDARRLNIDLFESGGSQLAAVFVLFERTGDAADPKKHALADLGQHFAASDNVGHGKAPAWLQNAKGFPQYPDLCPLRD